MHYTSRSKVEAVEWQQDLRATLFRLLKLDDLVSSAAEIPFETETLSVEELNGYTKSELALNSTPDRRIRVVLTMPTSAAAGRLCEPRSCRMAGVRQVGTFARTSPGELHSPACSDQRQDAGRAVQLPSVTGVRECNSRTSDVVTVPTEAGEPVPAVVCIHGHSGSRHIVHDPDSPYKAFAAVLAAEGFATISTDVGQHEVYEDGRTLMGERLWDVMRCVEYLASLPEVDASRIGCAGLSLGGEMAMWLGAMDTRVAATVSSGFLTFMDHMEQNHCLCWKFDGLREVADYPDLYSLIAPRPLLCQNGLKENPTQFYVPLARKAMDEVNVIYGDFGCPDLATLDVHEGGHEINVPTLRAFFREHLASPGG